MTGPAPGRPDEDRSPAERSELARGAVPQWQPSAALLALDSLVDAAMAAQPALARRAQLSESELHALRSLSRHRLGPAELARHLGVTAAAATGIIDRLVARGHVEREPHPTDRRRTVLSLTEVGRQEAGRLLTPMFTALQAADTKLSEDEKAVVARFLGEATTAIQMVM
ncbi:MarR family transcriptional regulator [Luteococcus sp. OSA5]|uniref:MarR family transcriptional regulator n=1 Tax=Luteococcus sp. OSA5 TaxID=3401630 RepID=UPI003B42F354